MNRFKSSAELKALAREHLLGHYGTVIAAEIIIFVLTVSVSLTVSILTDTTTVFGTIIGYVILGLASIVMGIFTSGTSYLYLKLICGRPVRIEDLFYGFQQGTDKALQMQAWISLLIYLSSLPQFILTYKISAVRNQPERIMSLMLPYALSLILSGVVSLIVGLVYAQAFYLLHDFPQYSAKELLQKSRRLMVHHKGRLFYLNVSFLPLILLGVFSCGIALLWVYPYMTATRTEFFMNLIRNNTEAVNR